MVLPDGVAIKNPPDSAGDGIPSVGGEDPLEKEMATHSSILAWISLVVTNGEAG